ncbi:MAG: KamA family radical SAM protein [candidate division WOR-3 bacterium]|nr:MAG: KamA family radical SAM protein [candidate division WOR-3 bacterium]
MKKRTAVTVRAVVPREPEVSAEESEPPGTIADKVGSVSHRSNSLGRLAELLETGLPGNGIGGELAQRASPRSLVFRARVFPEASPAQWQDWRWQMRHRFRDRAGLEQVLRLSGPEQEALDTGSGRLPLSITPYYASLLDPDDPGQALRRTVVPVPDELVRSTGEAEDPLSEDRNSPVPGLVHRYPDRVLFLVTGVCSVYCRYCTRSRMVGRHRHCFDPGLWEAALEYIAGTPAVRDVLLSGGDPLTMPGERLELLLGRLRAIPHVEIVRIGTKVPVVLPQRVTSGLVRMLRRYHPLWMSIHFTHPDELTPEVALACSRLADAGIPLGSQTVLLRGINDDVETMRRLVHGLMQNRVRPYYLYQCDPISGSAHFRTPVERGLEIIQGLRGHTSGYAVPTFVVDAPGGGGKIPLLPDPVAEREDGNLLLRNYQGRVFRYPDTAR